MVADLSAAQARRIALAAQGFGQAHKPVGTRQLNLFLQRLQVLQLDSVNVFERSHYLPAFARLGAYDKSLLDKLTFTPRAPYIEYWAHQAALIPRRGVAAVGLVSRERARRTRQCRRQVACRKPADGAVSAKRTRGQGPDESE